MTASREPAGPDRLPAAMLEARFASLRAQGPQPTPPPGTPPVPPPDPSRPPPIKEPPPPIPIPRPEPPPRPIDDPPPAAALAKPQAVPDHSSGGSALLQLVGSRLQLGSHRAKLLREGRPMRARNLAQPARSLSEK